MRSVVPYMNLMKLSDEECVLLTDKSDPQEAAASLLAQGPSVVAVTLGEGGAMSAVPMVVWKFPLSQQLRLMQQEQATPSGEDSLRRFAKAARSLRSLPWMILRSLHVRAMPSPRSVYANVVLFPQCPPALRWKNCSTSSTSPLDV